jgi:hypothetical protein
MNELSGELGECRQAKDESWTKIGTQISADRQDRYQKRHIDTHHLKNNIFQNARTTLTTILNCSNKDGCHVIFEEN